MHLGGMRGGVTTIMTIAPRLRALLRLLGSAHGSEVIATVHALRRELAAAGLDLHALADIVEQMGEPKMTVENRFISHSSVSSRAPRVLFKPQTNHRGFPMNQAPYLLRRDIPGYLREKTGLTLSISMLNKLCAEGRGPRPTLRLGHRLVYTREDVDEWARNFIEECRLRHDRACERPTG